MDVNETMSAVTKAVFIFFRQDLQKGKMWTYGSGLLTSAFTFLFKRKKVEQWYTVCEHSDTG